MLVVIAGFALALGYGVSQGFIEISAAALALFFVLAAVVSAADVLEVVEVQAATPSATLKASTSVPIGFHPSD